MNWVDVFIIIISVAFAFAGWRFGVIWAAFIIAGLFIGVVLAGQYYQSWGKESWTSIPAFVIILIVVIIASAAVGFLVRGISRFVLLGWVDKLSGMAIGLLVGAIFCAAILSGAAKAGVGEKAISESAVAEFFIEHFPLLLGLLPKKFDSLKGFFV